MDDQNATMRSFIAVEMDEKTIESLKRIQDDISSRVPRGAVKWVAASSIHLTLKFLGDTRVSILEEVERGIERAVKGTNPFEIRIKGTGCFPSCRRPRVIWIGVEDESGELRSLQKRVDSEMESLGWKPEDRPFSPHLTLGRVRKGLVSTEIAEIGKVVSAEKAGNVGVVFVNSVVLMKSTLTPRGAQYDLIFRASFL